MWVACSPTQCGKSRLCCGHCNNFMKVAANNLSKKLVHLGTCSEFKKETSAEGDDGHDLFSGVVCGCAQWCRPVVQWCGLRHGVVVQCSGAVVQHGAVCGAVVQWWCSAWCSAVPCGAVQITVHCLFWGIVPPKGSPHQWFSWARLEFPGIPQEFLFLEFLREIPSPTSGSQGIRKCPLSVTYRLVGLYRRTIYVFGTCKF